MNPIPLPFPSKVTSLFVLVTFFGAFLVVVTSIVVSEDEARDGDSGFTGESSFLSISACRRFGDMTSKFTGFEAPKERRFVDLESVVVNEVVFNGLAFAVAEPPVDDAIVAADGEDPSMDSPTRWRWGFGELITASADCDSSSG